MARLVGLGTPLAGRDFALGGKECLVGRALDCDITIQDQRISRRHARLVRAQDGLHLEDLGSVNGTFLNSRRVQGQALVHNGDEITIGNARFRVDLSDEGVVPMSDVGRVTVLDASDLGAVGVIEVANLRHDDALKRRATDSNVAAERELLQLQRKLRTLYQVGEAVASALEPRALLSKVLEQLMEVYPQANSAQAAIVDARSQELRTVASMPHDEHEPPAPMVIPAGVVDRVLRQGRSVLLRRAPDRGTLAGMDEGRVTVVSPPPGDAGGVTGWRMGAPLSFRGEHLGILHIEADPARGAFTQADLDLLGGIAAQAGVALHLAGMHQKMMVRDRLDKDLTIARQIQRNLLPREPPNVTGLDFAVHYEPAFHVGGDFFDFLWLDPSHLALVVGDVSGKAVSGALFMARVASEFRAQAPLESAPQRLMARVNRSVASVAEDGMFCTALLLSIDLETHVARFANAGHTIPLVLRGGRVLQVENPLARTAPLGLEAHMDGGEGELALEPGDIVLLYTDGLLEARAVDGSYYGQERLESVLSRGYPNARAVIDAILSDIDAFVGDAAQSDDQTIVCFRVSDRSSRRCASLFPPTL